MAKEKEVKVKIKAELEDSELKSLEQELKKLKDKKIELKLDADKSKLTEVEAELKKLQNYKNMELPMGLKLDKHELETTEREIKQLEQDKLDLEIKLQQGELSQAKSKIKDIEEDKIDVNLDTTNALLGLESLKNGFSGLKLSIQEIGQHFSQVMSSAGRYETNLAYLANSMGLDQAKSKMEEINDIVAKLPGDDTAIGGILSSAAARDSSLTKDNLQSIAASAADYMAAMSYYGKTATEAQQDMTNYILTGNTAEIERSPILSGHIDKLKQATTIQERQKLLAEALNQEGWDGMSRADTYNNKLETFNGMLERGRQNLGLMFMQGSKGAMDFLINLDGATGGMVGLTAAAFGFIEPIGQGLMSIGQMAQGLQALGVNGENLRKLGGHFKDIYGNLKKMASVIRSDVIPALLEMAATALANPYVLLALAIIGIAAALWYLYNTNEEFRDSVNKLFDDLKRLASGDWHVVVEYEEKGIDTAIDTAENLAGNDVSQGLSRLLMGDEAVEQANAQMPQFFENIKGSFHEGMEAFWNDGTQGFLGWLGQISGIDIMPYLTGVWNGFMSIPQWINQAEQQTIQTLQGMLGHVGSILSSIEQKAASFASNFASKIGSAAQDAWNNFWNGINGMWHKMQEEVDNILAEARRLVENLPNIIAQAAGNMVLSWGVNSGQHSPGFMYYMMKGEIDAMDKLTSNTPVPQNMANVASDMVGGFNVKGLVGNGSGSTGTVVNNEFNFVINGDVDSDERMKQFADYIIELMNWDNNTAGRTV